MSRKATIIAEYETCADIHELADRLGMKYGSLKAYACKLGLSRRKPGNAYEKLQPIEPYIPRKGGATDKAVKYLQALPRGAEIDSDVLCAVIGARRARLLALMSSPVAAGLIKYRMASEKLRAPMLWSLGEIPKPKAKVMPVGKEWQKQARMTWANAAAKRIAGTKTAKKPVVDAPVVIPPHVKVQKLPGFTGDVRFKPDRKAEGCGFLAEWRRLTA